MSDYETLFFLERQEAFWKGRKLSGRSRKLSGRAGSFLVYHEASDGPFGTLGLVANQNDFGANQKDFGANFALVGEVYQGWPLLGQ